MTSSISPPFFAFAGGLSLAFSPDHVVIDHVDADAGLALWLARRLTLAGFRVWCRGLAPLAGCSATDTIRSLITSRAYRYVAVLSPEGVADPEFTARRNAALAAGAHRGSPILLPAIARPFDTNLVEVAKKNPAQLLTAKVKYTIVGGRIIYETK